MGSATLTGTEFARVTKSYSSYSLSWIGSYTYTQDPVANTTTFTLYGSMYTGSSSNVRSANSTDVEQVNGVTISPPTPTAYRYSSNMEYGFSVNNGYSLFGSTTKTVTHNADGSFPSTSISIYSKNYHHNGLSASGAISAPAIDRSAPTVTASATQASETTVTLSVSANVNCNKWEYKVDSGSWVSFSTTNTTSVSTTVSLTTGASHTITARATKTYNGVVGTSSGVSVDKTAPTVSCSATNSAATSVSLSASSNVNCNKWEYRIGSGSWTTFSTTNGKSASTTVSGLSAGTTGTITVRATRSDNYVTATASASYDKTAPTITSASTSNIGANSCTLSVSANVNCNKWEYQIGSGSWVTFSSTNGTSASTSITGLSPATTYTINVRVTKTANYVTASSSTSASTLGYSQIDSIANINVDNSAVVKFTPYSASFYFKVAFSLSGTTIATNTIGCPNKTTQHSYTTQYTFPASILPASTSGTVTATLYTYTNSSYNVLVGSATKTFTITVPNTATYQPSGSLTLTPYNTNTWINNKGLYVGGYSAINIKVNNPAGGSGSTISTTVVNPTSTTVSTNNYRTSTLSAGTQNVSVVLTDRRGRSTTLTASASFLSYSSPSVTTFATERGTYNNGTWTAADDGNHIRATVTTSCSLSANGNTATATVRCVIGGTATAPNATSGNYYYWTGTTSETSYVVTVSVTDSVGNTTTFSSTVNAIAVPFNLNTSMPAAAFGKVAERANTLEVAPDWSLVANGKNNTMAYMPYSYWGTNHSGATGYARVATFTFIASDCYLPIEIKVNRMFDYGVQTFYFRASSSGVDPTNVFFYADYSGVNNTVDAFVYKTAPSTWEMYVLKRDAWDVMCARVFVPPYDQQRVNVTFTDGIRDSVPSNAIKATQIGALQYRYDTFSSTQSLVFSIANGATRKLSGVTTGECAWLLSCTGWAQNIRSGLWYIAGYNDSSRADVTTLKTASSISISAVSGELAWNISNSGGQSALFTCTVLYGAMPTIT